MERFTHLWNRAEPGVPRGGVPRTGLALLAVTAWREAWELVMLNLLIAVSCVPIVTIPTAQAAGARVAIAMLEDEPIYLWRHYWRAFRNCFVRATTVGLALAALITGGLWVAWIYAQLARQSPTYLGPLVVAVCVALFAALTALNAIVLIAREGRARPALLRRAALATLARPLPTLVGLGAVVALWLVHVIFYPVSVLMPAVFSFSLGTLIATFAVLPGVDRVLTRIPGAEENRATQLEKETRCET
jgi:uncharacterized membrane protein YesL